MTHGWLVPAHPVVGFLLLVLVLFLLSGIRYIPNNKIGIVEKRMSGRGSIKSGIIALNGEAGFQPNMLRGGLHYLMPIQYAVHVLPIVTIPQGKIGYVFARDGKPLPPSQTLASNEKGGRLPGRRHVPQGRRLERSRSARSCAKARTRFTSRSSS